MKKKQFLVGSMFAGVGGICLGFLNANHENAEYQIAWANEMDSHACETYRTNFTHPMLEGNIEYILHPDRSDAPEYYQSQHNIMFEKPIDVLNAGFPCQTFSIAGEQKGFEDERGILFLSIIDLIEQLDQKFLQKPEILFLENVKNLKLHDHGHTYAVIKSMLEDCGYYMKEAVLNTADYTDVPQHRERMYMIGFLKKCDADKFQMFDHLQDFQKKHTKEDWKSIIQGILDMDEQDPKYFYTREKYPHYFEPVEGPYKKAERVNLKDEIKEYWQFYQLRRGMYVRKNMSNVCPTLTANMGTGGHNVPLILTPYGIRKLTPKETFLLQGFPVGAGYKLPEQYAGRPYPDSSLYKQSGNSVSVPMIQILSEEILKVIN